MISPAEQDAAIGFDALLATHGETVTFRGQGLLVLVDRNPAGEADDKRFPDLSERERSVIALPRIAVTPLPRSGETATDGYGHNHRVVKVEPRGETYYLYCKVTS